MSYLAFQFIYLFLISMLPNVDFFGHFGSFFGGIFIGLSCLKAGELFGSRHKAKIVQLVGRIALCAYSVTLIYGIFL